MSRSILILAALMLVTACSAGSGNYKRPSVSSDPGKMSAETLCFRYASAKDPKLGDEIDARGIDCFAVLEDDPLYTDPSMSHGGLRY